MEKKQRCARLIYMTSDDSPTADVWDVRTLRLTAFQVDAPSTLDLPQAWQQLLGQAPAKEVIERASEQWEGQGPLELDEDRAGLITLMAARNRLDWRLVATPPDTPEGELQPLGAFTASVRVFYDLMNTWLSSVEFDVVRLAFGVILEQQTDSREESYGILQTYLPFSLPEDSQDFLYRINRPVASGITDIGMINRLRTWSAVRRETLLLTLAGSGATTAQTTGHPESAARLELDLSTAAERPEPLPKACLPELLNELVELAGGIAERGDREDQL